MSKDHRRERDSLGEREIPAGAYYGIQTLRAVENYPISGLKTSPAYLEATVQIKRAAAAVNKHLGLLDGTKADAIVRAADEVLKGELREWFVVDVYQAGAGTSHNMNCNEVLANRAIEILGGNKGDYTLIHPNDHVNMAQSTNDVCPSALRMAGCEESGKLVESLEHLADDFRKKGKEFDGVVKSGRTHLMDAAPVRLGQEFAAYSTNLKRHCESIGAAARDCEELGLGGTAVGTGLNAHPQYPALVVAQLNRQTGRSYRPAGDLFESMQSLRPVIALSGAVRNLAQDVIRISNDLRLMASGPTTGIAEIGLPAVQPGSSIMPGKVNPSIPEMVTQVCFQALGCDTTIMLAGQAGQLELNVMVPVVAHNLVHMTGTMSRALGVLGQRCVRGIVADQEQCRRYAERSTSVVTVLNPHIGYAAGAEIVKESLRTGKSVRELVLERNLLTAEQIDRILDLQRMTEPGIHT